MAKQNKGRKFFATTATAALVASAIVPVASAADVNDFHQVPSWAKDAVQYLIDNGSVQGDQNGNFNPTKNLTRAQAAEILTKELGLEATGTENFTDVSESNWFYNAVLATSPEIFNGNEKGEFKPNANLTRQEAAKVLVEAYGLTGSASLAGFPDASKVPGWSKSYLETAVANGVINGKGALLAPTDNISNAEFATMVKRAIDASSNVAVESVTAINNTTVEVTFTEEVENVTDFAIEGLEVTNAVVKQTNKKVVVLTTAAQTAGKEYTVTQAGNKLGAFKGVSAVIPTKVEFVTNSTQGKLGQQVTVQAKVSVKEGDSKAGIPVTFNIPGDNGTLKETLTKEVTTNADGVATYTYTRYAATTDAVTAYATGDRSKFATAYVFWGVDTIISIEDVTEGATINNGANKNYKVKVTDPTTGKVAANKRLLVSIAENLNVTVDKVQDVKVNGQYVKQLTNGTAPVVAEIVTDSKGEATFTVSGVNANATPVVYEPVKYQSNGTIATADRGYTQSALQATGSTVKFAAVQAEYTIELTRDGGEEAATGVKNGRKYNILVKDKAGNPAKFETVNINFNEILDRVLTTNTNAYFIKDGAKVAGPINVKTNAKGEASFVIGSDSNTDYATPLAWIDGSGSTGVDGQFDVGEANTVGELTYFTTAKLTSGTLTVYNGSTKTTEFKGTEKAKFQLDLSNQSGKAIALADTGYNSIEAEFTVHNDGPGNIYVDGNEVAPNRHITLTRTSTSPAVEIQPKGDVTTNVRVVVNGTAKDSTGVKAPFVFTTKEATAKFTSTTSVVTEKTYTVLSIDTDAEELTFVGKDAISYTDDVVAYYNTGGVEIDEAEFVRQILAASSGVTVTYKEDADGNVTLKLAYVNATGIAKPVDVTGKVYVTNVTATPATTNTANNGYLIAGDVLEIELTTSEAINLTGATPTLALTADTGETLSGTVAYSSAKSTSSKIVFTYTVGASDAAANVTLGTVTFTGVTADDTTKTVADSLTLVSGTDFAYVVDTTKVGSTFSASATSTAAGATTTVDFAEDLTQESKDAIVAAISAQIAGVTATDVSFTWDTAGKLSIKNNHASTALTFTNNATVTNVTDLAGNITASVAITLK